MKEDDLRMYSFISVEMEPLRLQLTQIDGPLSMSTILINGKSTTAVEAYPGQYIASLESLSVTNKWTKKLKVELSNDGTVVALPEAGVAKTEMRYQPQQSESRPSEERKYFKSSDGAMKLLSKGPSFTRNTKDRTRNKPNHRRFSIGILQPQAEKFAVPGDAVDFKVTMHDRGVVVRCIPNDAGSNTSLQITLKVDELPPVVVSPPIFSDGVAISFIKKPDKSDLRVVIEPISSKAKAVMAALDGISASEARSIIDWAGVLGHSVEISPDYWLETGAALLMIRTRNVSSDTAGWMLDLARVANMIPDAAVVGAWASAALGKDPSEAEEQVLGHLMAARQIGTAVFSAGHALAIDLLSALRSSAVCERVRNIADRELREWIFNSSHTIRSNAYQILEKPGKHLKRKAAGYIVAHGEIAHDRLLYDVDRP